MGFMIQARLRALSSTLLAAGLLAVGVLTAGPVRSAEAPTYLQMAGMTALAATADGRRSNVPVTVFIQVNNLAAAGEICRRVPVVRGAVLEATSQQPIPYAKGQLDSDAISSFIVGRINVALGNKSVARIGFVHGTPKEAAATTTDLADVGDMTARDKTVKTGQAGQMAPCRRIVAPPASLKWVDAKVERKPAQGMAPPAPPLRENRAPALPAPEFKSHPQFAPPMPEAGPKPRSEAPPATPPPVALITTVGLPEQVQADTPPSVRDCVPLDKIWKSTRYPYAGTVYTLSRIFTIDTAGRGTPDNIGFVLSAPNHPDFIFRYFDEPGRAAIDLFPSLTLKDSRSITGICFGQFDPDTLLSAAMTQIVDRMAIDILQPSPSSAPLVQATGVGFWISILVVAVGLIGAMSAAIILLRRHRADKAGDDGEGADTEGNRRAGERRKNAITVEMDRRAKPDRRTK